MGNQYEQAARDRKVGTLLLTARARRITASQVAGQDNPAEGVWVRDMLIANTPGVAAASDATWRQLVMTLHAAEELDSINVPLVCGCQPTIGCCEQCCSFPRCLPHCNGKAVA